MKFMMLMVVCLFLETANASITIRGETSGSHFRWVTGATAFEDYSIPFDAYFNRGQQGATAKWIPGGLYNVANANSIVLTLDGGVTQVTVPIELSGMMYGMEAASSEGDSQNIASVCPENTSSTPYLYVIGTNCFYDKYIEQDYLDGAYHFAKPILKLNETAVASAFKGAPDGVYKGTVPVKFNHRWTNFNGTWTQTIYDELLTIEIKNTANEITNVIVTQRDEMTPQYDLLNETVSGRTHYPVLAQGRFHTGLRLSLKDVNRQYKLTGPSGSEIPYSIECSECQDSTLVDSGQVLNSTTLILDAGATEINFNIDVFYEDADLNSIEHGRYQDSFVLLFEPEI
ncbi:hypothetical protein MSG34_06920 [Vibrio sp. 1CM2L]|uniref:hypothetical protein n=1 Tax=Vibrio TaxID=662 RepID=UPI000EFCAE9F|nr:MULTISPECIES: hypothetical protein [Vibrio]MCK8075882.1 hypothetical protein [Vibrio sp. 1CM2L]